MGKKLINKTQLLEEKLPGFSRWALDCGQMHFDDIQSQGNLIIQYLKWKFFTFKPVSIYEKKHCGL